MSNLVNRIQTDFMSAYRAKDFIRKNSLALVKSEIDLIEKERVCLDDDVYAILTKLLKWINETLLVKSTPEILAEKELYDSYMPKQLTRDEMKSILESSFKKPYNVRDVMFYFKENYWRSIDNKILSELIRE